jgi:hypothetical protein
MSRLWRHPCASIAVIGLTGAAVITPVAHGRQADAARIYVTVMGANDAPVPRLTAADFKVYENKEEKNVTSADLATDPLSVEIITDRLGGRPEFTPVQMRAALMALVHTIQSVSPDSQISLRTFDSESIQQVKPTTSTDLLDRSIKKLFSNNGASVLLEAISDAARALQKAPNSHRAIIGLVAGYKPDTSGVFSRSTADVLRQSKASFWVLEAAAAAVSNPNRDVMLTQGTEESGGWHTAVSTGTALETAATRLAVLLVSQYGVTYAAPGIGANRRIDVTVRGDGLHVLAAHWVADK